MPGVKNFLETDVPFGPIVPDRDQAPTVCPGHHECAESVLIIDVHAIFFHTSLAVTIGRGPAVEIFTGIWISYGHCVQGLAGAKIGYGHLVQELIGASGSGQLMYMLCKLIIDVHAVIVVFLCQRVVESQYTHESAHVYFGNALVIQDQH